MFEIFDSTLPHNGSNGYWVHYWHQDNGEYKVNEGWMLVPIPNNWNCD